MHVHELRISKEFCFREHPPVLLFKRHRIDMHPICEITCETYSNLVRPLRIATYHFHHLSCTKSPSTIPTPLIELQMTMQEFLQHLSLWVCLRYLVGVWLLHITSLLAYRAIWHPLASYPGPILARVTYLYEFWFDVVLGGRYTREIGGLHAQYGMLWSS